MPNFTDEQRKLAIEYLVPAFQKALHPLEVSDGERQLEAQLVPTFAEMPREVLEKMCAHVLYRMQYFRSSLVVGVGLFSELLENELLLTGLVSVEAATLQRELENLAKAASDRGKAAVVARHSRPGGARDKREHLQAVFASGKYETRAKCAERECEALGLSYDAARNALKNTPDPATWIKKKTGRHLRRIG